MNKYLKLYISHSQYVNPEIRPNVSYCKQENEVHYNPKLHDYSKDYFTIKSLDDNNTIYLKASDTTITKTVSVSTDNGATWTEHISSTDGNGTILATLNKDERLLVKGENATYATSNTVYNLFKSTGKFNVKGNIMSLVNGDSFTNVYGLTSNNTFRQLFYQCTELVSAENLVLSAITLSTDCYHNMFYGCTGLKKAPEILATVLAQRCCESMFHGCTNLTTSPIILPAKTLQMRCYLDMFGGCTNLVTTPKLPATTLGERCYQGMFNGCTSIVTAPALPATTLTDYCYAGMFEGCTSLITAPELPATTLTLDCYGSMFSGCTSLTTAPVLPASTLKYLCYSSMFKNCTNLTSITCLITNYLAGNTTDWVKSVAPNGTFIKHPSMTGWTTGVNGIPEGWETTDFVPSDNYLTFDILSNGTIVWKASTAETTVATISYSINGREWTDITSSTAGTSFNVSAGDKVRFKGNNAGYATSVVNYNTFSDSTASFNLEGNIMSLIDDTIFDYKTTLDTSYTFDFLFRDTNVNNAENLILPATTLTTYCYQYMFWNCTNLTTAPSVLPATTLAEGCYLGMFVSCTSLTTAPELPATTLAQGCYADMFNGCTSLTTAPELPATTLAEYCYKSMFHNCTSLVSAPELPATVLAQGCYQNMFNGCTSLNYIKCLATNIWASDCTTNWVSGVSNNGSFITSPNMENWTQGVNGVPYGWTINGVLPPTALMRIWIDDFPSDIDDGDVQGRMEAEVSDPSGEGANPYLYYEETIDYNGNTYYLWKAEPGYAANNENSKYFVTTTVDFNTLYNQSLEDDLSNHFTSAIGTFDDSKGIYRAQNINPDGDDDHYLIKVEDLS